MVVALRDGLEVEGTGRDREVPAPIGKAPRWLWRDLPDHTPSSAANFVPSGNWFCFFVILFPFLPSLPSILNNMLFRIVAVLMQFLEQWGSDLMRVFETLQEYK